MAKGRAGNLPPEGAVPEWTGTPAELVLDEAKPPDVAQLADRASPRRAPEQEVQQGASGTPRPGDEDHADRRFGAHPPIFAAEVLSVARGSRSAAAAAT